MEGPALATFAMSVLSPKQRGVGKASAPRSLQSKERRRRGGQRDREMNRASSALGMRQREAMGFSGNGGHAPALRGWSYLSARTRDRPRLPYRSLGPSHIKKHGG